MSLETRFETETKCRDSITGNYLSFTKKLMLGKVRNISKCGLNFVMHLMKGTKTQNIFTYTDSS